jgi:hypothetical protein
MSVVLLSPDKDSRSIGSAQTSTALSWLIAWVRDLIAEALACGVPKVGLRHLTW